MKKLKYLFVLSVIFNILFLLIGSYFVYHKGGMEYIKLSINKLTSKQVLATVKSDKVDLFKSYPHTENDVVFLGDSLTNACSWADYFPGKYTRNRGIGADCTSDIINRLDEIINGKPSKIFLMVGINDLLFNVDQKEMLSNYEQIIKIISEQTPDTKIFIQSILPINIQLAKKTQVLHFANKDIDNINLELEKIAIKYNARYIDLSSKYNDPDGELSPESTTDGIHLKPDKYFIWVNTIEQYI